MLKLGLKLERSFYIASASIKNCNEIKLHFQVNFQPHYVNSTFDQGSKLIRALPGRDPKAHPWRFLQKPDYLRFVLPSSAFYSSRHFLHYIRTSKWERAHIPFTENKSFLLASRHQTKGAGRATWWLLRPYQHRCFFFLLNSLNEKLRNCDGMKGRKTSDDSTRSKSEPISSHILFMSFCHLWWLVRLRIERYNQMEYHGESHSYSKAVLFNLTFELNRID